MVLINRSQANTVVVTLAEKATITNPFYLWSIVDTRGDVVKNFIATDVSTFKNRYNKFTITEVGDAGVENLLTGSIKIKLPGDYNYIVREQASSSNLDPALSGAIVEKGIFRIVQSQVTRKAYNQEIITKSYKS